MSGRHLFYLHGFASSAGSSKARFFAERLARRGHALHCPDFNEPDFSSLTITRMLEQLDAAMAARPRAPVALIGSSLGGFVAVHAAARARARRHGPPIDRLILLAPALDLGSGTDWQLGAERFAEWRATGRLEVEHYGFGERRWVHYELYADAQTYDAMDARLDMPVLIFHGRRDEVVDPAMVERFANARPTVSLRLLDDGHQLLESLDLLWHESARFLGVLP